MEFDLHESIFNLIQMTPDKVIHLRSYFRPLFHQEPITRDNPGYGLLFSPTKLFLCVKVSPTQGQATCCWTVVILLTNYSDSFDPGEALSDAYQNKLFSCSKIKIPISLSKIKAGKHFQYGCYLIGESAYRKFCMVDLKVETVIKFCCSFNTLGTEVLLGLTCSLEPRYRRCLMSLLLVSTRM